MASDREPGWYWVKLHGHWMVAAFAISPLPKYTGWRIINVEYVVAESAFDQIGERIPDHE